MALIDSVERVRSRYHITVNGTRYVLSAALYRERPLNPGDELDLEEYEQWLLLHQYRAALDYAVSLLAQRACASGEIRQKLEMAGYIRQTVDMVLYKLTSNELLDDESFAKQWAAARSHRSLGTQRIAMELRHKGITADDAEEALASIPEEEQLETAAALARKVFSRADSGEDRRKTRQRILQTLARRGYPYDLAKQAAQQVLAGDDDESLDDGY